jgi:hypothetical protein
MMHRLGAVICSKRIIKKFPCGLASPARSELAGTSDVQLSNVTFNANAIIG